MSYLEKRKRNLKLKLKEKLHTQRQRESPIYIMYRNQMYHLILQLWKLPRKIPRHKPVKVKYSQRPLWIKVNSSSIDNRSTLPGPTSAGSAGVAAPKPAASPITKSVAANLPIPVERNRKLRSDRVPKEGNDPIALHNKFEALEHVHCAQFPSSTRVRSHSSKKQKGRAHQANMNRPTLLKWNYRGFKINFNEPSLLIQNHWLVALCLQGTHLKW